MTDILVTHLPTGGVLVGIDYPTYDLTVERAEALHAEGIDHDESPCPICRAETLAQELDERCGSCQQVLKVDRDGYPMHHWNRGDGECGYSTAPRQ